MTERDYYTILGVDQGADSKQIKEAFRQLALKFHPDLNQGNPEAADKMKWLNEAYAVLSNPDKRREYDSIRRQFGSSAYGKFRQTYSERDIFSGSDINQIFEQMARASGLRGFEEIFKEFYGQGYQNYEFRKPGVFTGRWVFPGKAGQQPWSIFTGNVGKIYKYLFKKMSGVELPENGAHIRDTIYLSPEQARDGGPYAYYLKKNAKKLVVKIPGGINEGQKIRLAGMGEKGKGGGEPGDLYLMVHITRPLLQTIRDFVRGIRKKTR